MEADIMLPSPVHSPSAATNKNLEYCFPFRTNQICLPWFLCLFKLQWSLPSKRKNSSSNNHSAITPLLQTLGLVWMINVAELVKDYSWFSTCCFVSSSVHPTSSSLHSFSFFLYLHAQRGERRDGSLVNDK